MSDQHSVVKPDWKGVNEEGFARRRRLPDKTWRRDGLSTAVAVAGIGQSGRRRGSTSSDPGGRDGRYAGKDGSSDDEKDADDDLSRDWEDEDLRNFSGQGLMKLTLMEELLLLGLKDREGYTSFWNDNISTGLRGAIMVELALRHKIQLERCGARRRSLVHRKVQCIDSSSTGDFVLDEALKHIKECKSNFNVPTWIDYLSGDTWNPANFQYHLRNVRERLAKNLVDKGICSTQKQNFLIFDMTTHPLANTAIKSLLVSRVQQLLLGQWKSEFTKFKTRSLAIICLAHASDVLDNAFATLSYTDFDLATKHVRTLLSRDPDQEATKYDSRMEVLWAVVSTFNK